MSVATVQEVQWIGVGPAAKILGVSRETVINLVEAGRLSRRHVPGAWPKVRLDEIEALAKQCTTPARTAEGAAQ
jgi:hypothetical protein